MRVINGVLAVILMSMVTLVSCSKEQGELPVAKVADRVITLSVYEKTYFAVDDKFLPEDKGIEGRKEFLDTMINRDVMAIKADELGYDKDPYVVQGMEAFKKVSLQSAYMKIMVADKINVTEKDLKAGYELYKTNLQIKQILVDTKDEADELHAMLDEGQDFESVCKQYSKGPEAQSGGKVVNALWGTFEPTFQDELFSTPVGGYTKPLDSPYGYFIIKVLAKNQPKRKSYEETKPDLEILIRRQQEIRLTNEMSNKVRAKHNYEYFESNIRIVFDALPIDRPLTSPPDRSQEVYPLLNFESRDLDKPLVSYDNKTITVRDFSDFYDRSSFFNRPRREYRFGGVKKFVVDIVMNEIVPIEMKESRVEEEPMIALALQKKKEQFMVDKLFQDLIDKQTSVPPGELREYYDDNLEQFRRDEERRLGIVLVGSRELAQEAHGKIVGGENFGRISGEYSVDELTREDRSGAQFVRKGQNPDFDEPGFALENVGDVSEPFETSRGWMIVKLIERRPERILPFDEARSDISRVLKTIKNEERLNSLLEKWRSEIDIEIFEDNLKKANLEEEPRRAVKFV